LIVNRSKSSGSLSAVTRLVWLSVMKRMGPVLWHAWQHISSQVILISFLTITVTWLLELLLLDGMLCWADGWLHIARFWCWPTEGKHRYFHNQLHIVHEDDFHWSHWTCLGNRFVWLGLLLNCLACTNQLYGRSLTIEPSSWVDKVFPPSTVVSMISALTAFDSSLPNPTHFCVNWTSAEVWSG